MDLDEMYENNGDFKKYVDRYCVKHQIEKNHALKHLLVMCYAEYLKKSAEGKIITTTTITGGC